MKRVDNFEKGKPVEVCIPGANPPDSALAHQDGGVRAAEQIACQVR